MHPQRTDTRTALAPADRAQLDRAMQVAGMAALECSHDDGYTRCFTSPDGARSVTVVVATDGAASRLNVAVHQAAGALESAVRKALRGGRRLRNPFHQE